MDSQEMIGSLALHSTGKLPMNGNVNTIGSLSACSNTSITNLERKGTLGVSGPGASIFNKGRSDSIDNNMGTPSSRKINNNSLFKATLIKNSYNTSQYGTEERKDKEEEYEESCDVGEENSPVCNSVNKMNIEKSMKHNPSKCDEPSPKGTGTPTSKYAKSSLAKK